MTKRKRRPTHKPSGHRNARSPDGGAFAPPLPQAAQLAAAAAYQRGDWGEAERLCRLILNARADHFGALNLLGIIAAQTRRTEEAVELLTRAVSVNPNHAIAYNNRGNALRDLNSHEAALESYERAIALKPDYAEACNNRGITLFALERHAAALASFEQAIALQPSYAEAYYNRGNALVDLKRYAAALEDFDRAIALAPASAEACNNRGVVLQDLDRHAAALESYDRAIALKPDYAQAHNNRGNALRDLDRHEAALESYEQAIALRPDYAEAHYNRGNALLELKQPAEAIAAYRQALAHGSDAGRTGYALAALGAGPLPGAAPTQYVTHLFDRYADRFDRHLIVTLKYQTPALLVEQITRFCSAHDLDVLDLGCGTGLLGPLLRPLARALSGVDLSPNMLEKARQRQVYDDLTCAELTAFLQTTTKTFDLAAATDVFIYIGELAGVFAGVRNAVRHGGWFGFSIEASDGEDFVLRPTRRYAQSVAYLEKLANDHGFVMTDIEPQVIRREKGVDVNGYLVLMRRA